MNSTADSAAERDADRADDDKGRPPSPRFARGAYEQQPSGSSGVLEFEIEFRSADALRPECPDGEGPFLRQLAGLPAQGCSTDCLPIRPVAGRAVAPCSIDGPGIWDQPITAARPRRNWRVPLSAPHFPFHPTQALGRSTICTVGARYTKSGSLARFTSFRRYRGRASADSTRAIPHPSARRRSTRRRRERRDTDPIRSPLRLRRAPR